MPNTLVTRAKVAFAALALSLPVAAQAATTNVDLELALLIDVSGSVSTTEYNLQIQGYVDAFNSTEIQDAISDGAIGSIAATVVLWSGDTQQQQSIDWTLIDDATSAAAFATAIDAIVRPFSNLTAPGDAIDFIVNDTANANTFSENMFNGTRNVIDISGDGAQNDGIDTAAARDAALAGDIDAINGIAILGESGLESFYQNSIVGGTNSFFLAADSFDDFGDGISKKLIAEITDNPPAIPLPAAGWLLITALGGMGAFARRKAS